MTRRACEHATMPDFVEPELAGEWVRPLQTEDQAAYCEKDAAPGQGENPL